MDGLAYLVKVFRYFWTVRNAKILIAEDDADDQLLLKTAFAEIGAEVDLTFVGDGAELMTHLEGLTEHGASVAAPDLILLDLNMPRKSGKEALEDIKKDTRLRSLPVVIYTTTRDVREIQRCYDLGANSYIVKPANFESMVVIIETVMAYWLGTVSLPSISPKEEKRLHRQ